MFLSILSGFLFKFHIALILVCSCSAVGATLCYLLSQLVGRRLVRHYFPARAQQWSQQVDKHRNELLSYILFLRMTPFLPNWFINLVAPVIGVPLYPFAVGTFFGKSRNKYCLFTQTNLHHFWNFRCCTAIISSHSSWSNIKYYDQFIRCILIAINGNIRCICHFIINASYI